MATIGSTPRPAYVYDQETDTWVPVGVGPHTHDTFIPNTIIDAKGDLLAGSAPDTVGKLTVGANGTLLVADSTETLGMAWRSILTLTAPTSSTVPLTVKGATSQSANLFNVTDSSNNVLFSILPSGRVDWSTAGTFLASATAYRSGAGGSVSLRRSKTDTVNTNVALASGDNIANFQLWGNDGTNFVQSSAIWFDVDGPVSTGVMPGKIRFGTSVTSGSPDRMSIDSTGRVKITEGGVLEAPLVQNAQTVDYTLVLSDAGKLVECNKSTQFNITIPTNALVAYPIGTQIQFLQTGAGQISFAGGGIALNATPGTKTRAQWSSATLIKRGTDTWVVIGDLVP